MATAARTRRYVVVVEMGGRENVHVVTCYDEDKSTYNDCCFNDIFAFTKTPSAGCLSVAMTTKRSVGARQIFVLSFLIRPRRLWR